MEALISSMIGIISALFGYFFREYRNRAIPFINVFEISGNTKKLTDIIKLDEKVYSNLEDTFYIKRLYPKSSLEEINNRLQKSIEIKEFWPDLKKDIEKLLTLSKEDEIIDKVSALLNSDELKNWIIRLLVKDKIQIKDVNCETPNRIKVFYGEDRDKKREVWFAFPGNTVNFGNNLQHEAIMAKSKPFIDSIQKFDIESIKDIFGQLIECVEEEYKAAILVVHDLQVILDQESRWVFYVYFANLSNNPIIIKNQNFVEIIDSDKTKFIENTYMSVISEYEGKSYIQDTNYPLQLKPQSSITFCLITKNVQREMTKGQALRETFDKKTAKYRLILNLEKVGLFRKQTFKSKYNLFTKTE